MNKYGFLIHVPQVRFLPGAPAFTSLSAIYPFVKINQNQSNGAILNTENSTELAPLLLKKSGHIKSMEKFLNILPIIIMLESFAASVPLFICQKWGSAIYWFAAGLLNLAVIFLIKRSG